MTRPAPPPYRPRAGQAPPHAVHVLGGVSADVGSHVRSLAGGLVARGLRVTVCVPAGEEPPYGFAGTGAHVVPLPSRTEAEAAAALRRVCGEADVVHAHGLRAALLAAGALALGGLRAAVPLVVTWHHRTGAEGPRGRMVRFVERRAVRAASVVLAATTDLVDRARARGARDARLGPVAVGTLRGPAHEEGGGGTGPAAGPAGAAERAFHKARAEVGAVGRPLVFSVGGLDRRHDYGVALTAARAWRYLDPPPLLAVAGEGPDRGALQRRIDEEALPVRLLGRRDDAFELLAGADVALLTARWSGRSLLAQEALAEGVPLVASAVGGVPELVGGAALLVPHGDPDALAGAVTELLADPARRDRMAAAGRARAATWTTEEDTLVQVLSVYDELTAG